MEEYMDAMADDMAKALDALKTSLQKVRTGRATPQLVDGVQVNVASYGALMPLNQLATIQAPDARLITISPWDKGTIGDIEKAIRSADLGLNPSSDGQIVRVPVPALTAERRQDLVKQVRKLAEDIRQRVRGVRREYNDMFKEGEANGDITEDDLRKFLDRVQAATDATIKKVDDLSAAKEAEVVEV
jgi:ribosome recycling factor